MENKSIQKLKLTEICFLIFFLLKPFYIFKSGALQIGDVFLVFSYMLLFFERRTIKMEDEDKLLSVFLICVIVINSIYTVVLSSTSFLVSSLYYIFNLFVITCFRQYIKSEAFQSSLKKICKINLLVQLAVYLTGKGEYFGDSYRYMGTYNDPNQLGFAVLSTIFILYLLDKKIYTYMLISVFLILQTSSMGMILAIIILIGFYIINTHEGKKYLVITFIIGSLFIFLFNYKLDTQEIINHMRIEDKVNKSNNIFLSFLDDRNMMIILEHPLYFLFGFGEGMTDRYPGYHGELHSTMISLCYYYGIIPFIFFARWLIHNIKGITPYQMPVYIALLLEAFTLVNHRQPAFWMIIILASSEILKKKTNEKRTEVNC